MEDIVREFYAGSGALELEARVHPLSKEQFDMILSHAPSTPKFDTKTLDVRFKHGHKDLRARFVGPAAIQTYVSRKAGGLDATVVHKTQRACTHHYGCKVVLSDESAVQLTPAVAEDIVGLNKPSLLRLKHTASFDVLPNGKARVDASIVRTGRTFRDLMEAPVTSYECEVEFVRPQPGHSPLSAADVEACIATVARQKMSPYERAVETYIRLVYPKNVAEGLVTGPRERNPKALFFAPQPVALHAVNLTDGCSELSGDALNAPRIYDGNYTVTVKLDGCRCLLIGDEQGRLFLVGSDLKRAAAAESTDCVLCPAAKLTVADCEYCASQGEFHIFDLYFREGRDCRSLPFKSSREDQPDRWTEMRSLHEKLAECLRGGGDATTKAFPAARIKTFWDCDRPNVKVALEAMRSCPSDGLVFTPKHLAVMAAYPTHDPYARSSKAEDGSPPAANNNNNKTYAWHMVLKWKPVHTIDFRVSHDRATNSTNLEVRHVGGGGGVTGIPGMRGVSPMMTLCSDGRTYIPHGSVVECMWDGAAWVPLRVRYDKRAYLPAGSGGRGGGGEFAWTPNNSVTAADTWRCIRENITEEDLLLLPTNARAATSASSSYYRPTASDRSDMAIVGMMRFHNECVKLEHLIRPVAGRSESVLDLACGRGGDLFKWTGGGCGVRSTPILYVGVDLCNDNILAADGGALSRAANLRSPQQQHNTFFVCGDMTKNMLLPGWTSDSRSTAVWDHLWGRGEPMRGAGSFGAFSCPGSQQQGLQFDAVSCQFAIHYAFESEEKFEGFVRNVAACLAPGGFFVGTCLDGSAVMSRIAHLKKGECVRGRMECGYHLWMIRKLFSSDQPIVGRRIGVFLESIGQVIDEFLVDFEYLKFVLERNDISMVKSDTFDAVHDPVKHPLSVVEKEFSFMNRFFVFQKKWY